MVKNKKSFPWKIILIILVVGLLVWGFIGGQQSQNVGITCDFGIGDKEGFEGGKALCWSWHKNVVGQAQDALKNLFS
jgi:hypothetical protein